MLLFLVKNANVLNIWRYGNTQLNFISYWQDNEYIVEKDNTEQNKVKFLHLPL